MAEEQPTIISMAIVCQLLLLTRQRINQLVKDGWIKQIGRNRYGLVDAVQGYIRFLREDMRKHNRSAADSRVRDARAKEIEVKTAQRLGQLVPLTVYEDMIDRLAGFVRSELAGLPAACTRDLGMRSIIEREVNTRLRRMAEHAHSLAVRIETLGSVDAAERANGAGSVGGRKSDVPTNGSGSGSA